MKEPEKAYSTDDNTRKSIKYWAEDDRPREKLLKNGVSALSNAELIAILIGSGNKNESAVELARRILADANNNLNTLGKKNIHDLQQFLGMGEAKAVSIQAALELGRRYKLSQSEQFPKVTNSRDVFPLLQSRLSYLSHEEFWVLLLNSANRVIAMKQISSGGIQGVLVDGRLIYKYALEKMAVGIIVAHNHPSGNLTPSQKDIELTNQLKAGAKTLQIIFIDHIIVGEDNFFSFKDNDLL